MSSPTPLRFDVRHVNLVRGLFAILVALMVTFSPDHSAAVGLSVFSGFAIATGLVWALAAWLVYPSERRPVPALLAVVNLAAGMVAGIVTLRSTLMFFIMIIAWALITGLIELLWGVRTRRQVDRREGTDHIIVGSVAVLLAALVALVPIEFSHDYAVKDFHGTLTGITIDVGMFGAYAAIVGVFLLIAGLSPKPETAKQIETEVAS